MIGGDAAAPPRNGHDADEEILSGVYCRTSGESFRRRSPKGSSLWEPRGIWRNTMCIDCAAAF